MAILLVVPAALAVANLAYAGLIIVQTAVAPEGMSSLVPLADSLSRLTMAGLLLAFVIVLWKTLSKKDEDLLALVRQGAEERQKFQIALERASELLTKNRATLDRILEVLEHPNSHR